MKSTWLIILLVIIAGAAIYLLAADLGPQKDESTAEGKTKIAATIPPLKSIASEIAGDQIEVELVLPSGASPHTFEPTAGDLSRLENAEMVLAIGHGLDDWATPIAESLGAVTKTVDQDIELLEMSADAHSDEDHHDHNTEAETEHAHSHADQTVNPHYWLSVTNAKQIAKNIAGEITALDSQNQELYERNLAQYEAELDQLNSDIRNELASIPNRNIVTFHNAWPYFAADYDLEVVATFEPSPGKEPTPQYLKELQEAVAEYNVKTIFTEPQLSTQSLQSFLDDMDVSVAVLDPLGGDSYLEMMRQNAAAISDSQ